MMILMNFIDDLDAMTIERLSQYGYCFEQGDKAFKRFAMLLALTERKIPSIPYEVKLSTHLLENKKYNDKRHREVLEEIIQRLQDGESLHSYLSRKAPELDYKDDLLISWQIHHLHLSSIKTKDTNGFVSRIHGQSDLLFLRIDGSTAHLIDIASHSEKHLFSNPRLLEIIDENWPELHIDAKQVTGNIFSPEKIKNLRAHRVNYIISVNGRNIMPKPVATNGVPIDIQMMHRVLRHELENIEADVRRRFYEYFPRWVYSKHKGRLITEVKLVEIEDDHFVLQEQSSRLQCNALRTSSLA